LKIISCIKYICGGKDCQQDESRKIVRIKRKKYVDINAAGGYYRGHKDASCMMHNKETLLHPSLQQLSKNYQEELK
jgi:hypothetical protein